MSIKSQRGFTLIEIIIAIVVLSLTVGAMSVAFSELVRMSVLPELINTGVELAEQEMERVTGLRYSNVVNEGPVNFPGSFSNYSYQVSVTPVPSGLAVDPGMVQYKQAQITVSHATAGSVTLNTIVANN